MTFLQAMGVKMSSLVVLVAMQAFLLPGTPDDPTVKVSLSGVPAPYSFGRVCKLSSGDLWIVGGNGSVQRISNKGDVRRLNITDVDLNGVFFVGADSGWIVGEQGKIFHTKDGGLSWKEQSSGVPNVLHAITCTDKKRCWSVGEAGMILITNDGGRRWRPAASGVAVDLFAVAFVSDRVGWAVAEDGFILHTTNGGELWAKQQAPVMLFPDSPFRKRADLMAVKFINKDRGWVAGTGGVATTSDGGTTWKVQEIEGAAFIGLVSKNLDTVWAINQDGNNYLTTNGGEAWEPVKPNNSSPKPEMRVVTESRKPPREYYVDRHLRPVP